MGMQSLNLKDEHEMKIVSDNDKLEISLDTAGYKPDELRVTAGQGIVVIEAKHEERTQAGEVMVSRHMKRSYPLPSNSKPRGCKQSFQGWSPYCYSTKNAVNQ